MRERERERVNTCIQIPWSQQVLSRKSPSIELSSWAPVLEHWSPKCAFWDYFWDKAQLVLESHLSSPPWSHWCHQITDQMFQELTQVLKARVDVGYPLISVVQECIYEGKVYKSKWREDNESCKTKASSKIVPDGDRLTTYHCCPATSSFHSSNHTMCQSMTSTIGYFILFYPKYPRREFQIQNVNLVDTHLKEIKTIKTVHLMIKKEPVFKIIQQNQIRKISTYCIPSKNLS